MQNNFSELTLQYKITFLSSRNAADGIDPEKKAIESMLKTMSKFISRSRKYLS